MDMITYARLKKLLATGGNTELIESIITEEVTKVVGGADAKFDTLKEIADWIKSDTTGAAKMQTDISELKNNLTNIELTPGPQGPKGDKGDTGAAGKDGAQGPKGADGKTAYKYAQDGGYTGTEEEFASDLHEAMNPAQANWNENDETALTFIKNRPFYGEEGQYKWEKIVETASLNPPSGAYFAFVNISPCPDLIIGETYKVVIDGQEYIDTAKLREHSDGDSLYIGTNRKDSILSSTPFAPEEGELPFFITASHGGAICFFANHTGTITVDIYIQKPDIKLLDRRYINYIPGEKSAEKNVTYDGRDYICSFGAEIFNNYSDNLAIGGYSHAEGFMTTAIGENSHAEGEKTCAKGGASHAEGAETVAGAVYSHAEGYKTLAKNSASHSEGEKTLAEGYASHAEGYETKASGTYSHAEGYGTISATSFSHAQGTYNILDEDQNGPDLYGEGTWVGGGNVKTLDSTYTVYIINDTPHFNYKTGNYNFGNVTEVQAKDLKENDRILFDANVNAYFEIKSIKFIENDTKVEINCTQVGTSVFGKMGKYVHIIGNGGGEDARSNAHTLDWDGNAWYQGDVECSSIILRSSTEGSTKRFRLTINDSGNLTTTEITE